MPNPFSVLHYFLRNKRKSIALMAGLMLSMSVIAFVGGMISSIEENVRLARSFSSHFSVVEALVPEGVPQEQVGAMESHPEIARVYPLRQLRVQVPLLVGDTSVPVFVLPGDQLADLAGRLSLKVREGRLPAADGEIAMSRQMATAKRWRVGDVVGSEVTEGEALRGRFTIVGLLDEDPWVALALVELPASYTPDYLVVPAPGKRAEAEAWLEQSVASPQKVRAVTERYVTEMLQRDLGSFSLILAMLTVIVTLTNTVVTTLLAYIFIAQRRAEFALYLALGQPLGRVIRRVLTETFAVLFSGWVLGIGGTTALFWWIKQSFFVPRGLAFSVINRTVILHTLPSPIVITLVLGVVLTLLLVRFDYISAIEGRE